MTWTAKGIPYDAEIAIGNEGQVMGVVSNITSGNGHEVIKQKQSQAVRTNDASPLLLTNNEKAMYRDQLQANQKMIAIRFQSEPIAATVYNVDNAAASLSKLTMNSRFDGTQPGAQFVRRERLDINIANDTSANNTSDQYDLNLPPSLRPSLPSTANNTSFAYLANTASAASTSEAGEQEQPQSSPSAGKKRYRVAFTAGLLIALVTIAIVVSNVISKERSSDAKGGSTNSQTTTFNPYTVDCYTLMTQENPHVISQCHCQGKIFKLAASIKARYEDLTHTFVRTVLAEFNESIESCNPENQALVWLASGDGATTTEANLQQRYSLALLFIMWNGPHWKQAAQWLSIADECTWSGLGCNGDHVVTDIMLSSNGLSGELSGKLALLGGLTSLELDRNDFHNSSIPSELSLLAGLKNLALSSTGICGTIPKELFKTGNALQFLQADNNQLSGTIPTLIFQLSELNTWNVGNNNFTGTIPTEIGLCKNLSSFQYNGNSLHGTIPTEVKGMDLLTLLSLNDNRLTGTIPAQLRYCLYLQFLVLRNNHLHGTIPTDLGALSILATIDVFGNDITGTTPSSICSRTHSSLCFGTCSCHGCSCPGF